MAGPSSAEEKETNRSEPSGPWVWTLILLVSLPLIAGIVTSAMIAAMGVTVPSRGQSTGMEYQLLGVISLGVVVPLILLTMALRRSRWFPRPFAFWMFVATTAYCGPVYFDFLAGTNHYSPNWTHFNVFAAIGVSVATVFIVKPSPITSIFSK